MFILRSHWQYMWNSLNCRVIVTWYSYSIIIANIMRTFTYHISVRVFRLSSFQDPTPEVSIIPSVEILYKAELQLERSIHCNPAI